MIRLLHLADLHFDTIFASRRDRTRRELRKATSKAFENAIDFAIRESIDAVVIAGDLFDNDRLSFATERFIIRQLLRLDEESIPVVYVTGNHDPGGTLARASRIEWPSNCILIDQPLPIKRSFESRSGERFTVVGAGHASRDESENLAVTFPAAKDGEVWVGVLHTLVTDSPSSGGHEAYAPCSTADLSDLGYSYWALGHIHLRHQVDKQIEAWYSGNMVGGTPRESGPKGGLLVTIDRDNSVEVSFHEFSPLVWETVEVEVAPDTVHVDQLARKMEHLAEELLSGSGGVDHLLRFMVTGSSGIAAELRRPGEVDELEQVMMDVLGVLDVELHIGKLQMPLDLERYREEPHVLGRAMEIARKLLNDDQKILVRELLDGDCVIDWSSASEQMRDELTSGLEEDIAERMLKSP